MRRRVAAALCGIMALGLSVQAALAEPTRLMVRALAQDAKFIGTHTGGVDVTITDARSGRVLASGRILGGTGDTVRIMQTPRSRGQPLADAATAGFEGVLDLAEPTLVRVDARGPLGVPASTISVSTTLWMLPGRDVVGDGLVLTFPGFAIEPAVTRGTDGARTISAKVSMMCGCPITPGGLWDAADVTVRADLLADGRVVATVPLHYAGQPSQFVSEPVAAPSAVTSIRVSAASRTTSNAGSAMASMAP